MFNKQLSHCLSKILAVLLILTFLPSGKSAAQSGVLLPSDADAPDDSVLSLAVMDVEVCIDNQFATVRTVQIYDNHTAETLEGNYSFALPPNATVSDFAVWDGDTRIPGVVLEKRRAAAVYAEIKQEIIDPGLLQQGDEDDSGSSVFYAKVFPINPYSTKRVELEYTEMLPIDNLASYVTFPLKPSEGATQKVRDFRLRLCVNSDYAITPAFADVYPLTLSKNTPNEIDGTFAAQNVELNTDFSFRYQINAPASQLAFTAYRAPEIISAHDLRDPQAAVTNPDGYFEAKAIFNQTQGQPRGEPRRVTLLLDTSLSMRGEKLERAVEAVDYFLHNLRAGDEFNLILFNDDAQVFAENPVAAAPDKIENAVTFVKNSYLAGGTNLKKALEQAVKFSAKFSPGERSIILISDAEATLETRDYKKIEAVFAAAPNNFPLRFHAFALGVDANADLLKDLTDAKRGVFAQVRETEDISIALQSFFTKTNQPTIENLGFKTNDDANFYQIYSTSANSFDGSSAAFVGRYKQSKTQQISIFGSFGAEMLNLSREVVLPELAETHDYLPRHWARARVDALLREINRNGEREDYIAEIIRLSQKYKFVTPYTSFLAAPRALLRPRLIQPGDPVIRVKTDSSITSVFAVLPFGETLPLKFIESEKVWETRFLAPAWMPDGTYACRLILSDKNNLVYEEKKTFVVDSHAPKIKIELPAKSARAGDEILLKVAADKDTSRLVAKLYGAAPVRLAWSSEHKTNVGRLKIPENLAAGKYLVTVTAADPAHNQSTAEISLEVLAR